MCVASSFARSHDCDRVRLGSIECAGIQRQGLADTPLLGDVRMAKADQIISTACDGLAQQPAVVAVQEGHSPVLNLQFAKPSVKRLPGGLDGGANGLRSRVDVAQHEVRRPAAEHANDLGRPDVAAVDDLVDVQAFQHADCLAGVFDVPVRIADDSQNH